MTMARRTSIASTGRGFTLVEVLVALGIMATLAVMGWQGIDGIVRTRDASQARLDHTLRLGAVLTQWEQDLASLQETDAVPAFNYDGKTLRLTRRSGEGVQLVAWSLIGSTTQGNPDRLQWMRWAGPSVTSSVALQDSWLRSQLLQSNDPALMRTLDDVSELQLYCYRGNAWSNCQSTGNVVAVAAPASGVPASVRTALPSGLRLVLTLAGGNGGDGTLTRDVAFGSPTP